MKKRSWPGVLLSLFGTVRVGMVSVGMVLVGIVRVGMVTCTPRSEDISVGRYKYQLTVECVKLLFDIIAISPRGPNSQTENFVNL